MTSSRGDCTQQVWRRREGKRYCKRLNFRGLQFSRIGPKLEI
ncbi:MAG: hypothetical protein PV344_04600 [Anaplasma sp.]|nr:hypothetical protein [Anaplasma sp.]